MSTLNPQIVNYPFNFEPFLRKEYNLSLDPDRPPCQFWIPGKPGTNPHTNTSCPNGDSCYNKHISPMFSNKIVCKHWLRGLCKKGDNCEFLHEYNLRKMPECLFFSKNGFCTQTPECQYLHLDPSSKIPECLDYSKGFCPEGPNCKNRHIKRIICQNYLTGFCPDGPDCDLAHPNFQLLSDKLRIRPDRDQTANDDDENLRIFLEKQAKLDKLREEQLKHLNEVKY
ncbi:hypothetical protein WICPIJ_005414 [Wickerhamomyces pijperi]|uniref:mRNA 3'-end-processing protein n=1 Tax=Wickerhamomyces pijperi TaxID=599730 RepID=A0A9P8Q457_WICPI|nr:hypothetical protein WICPIJ_005414 [Wickerhamomyces pijperi]